MHVLVFLALFVLVSCEDEFIVPDGYIANRVDDYWFEFHGAHHLLLIVGKTCHVVAVDDVMDKMLRHKEQREQLEDDLYHNYILPKVHESSISLKDLRDEFHDLYANFQCIGKLVYKINYASPPQPTH